jgi:hypothetical protein
VIQFVANLRRVSVAAAAVALLSALMPTSSRAQTDPQPAAPDTTRAQAGATAQPATQPAAKRPAKAARAPKARSSAKSKPAAKSMASDSSAVSAAKPAKPAKTPKAAKVKAPEKSLEQQKKEDGVYAKNSNWISLRFGYAKRTGDVNGDGLVGYGVGYQHMIDRRYAFAAGAGHDIVGHFAGRLDEAVPFTAEFQRHYNWKTSVRPYVGLGGGFYFRKAYRTGADYTTTTTGGPHLSVGFTSALDDRHVIGFETRVALLQGRAGVTNTTFGPGKDTETIWTAKVSWALVY